MPIFFNMGILFLSGYIPMKEANMNVLILGNGFIANHLSEQLGYKIIPDRISLNPDLTYKIINKYNPEVLINCIGKTGVPNIDWCEKHENKYLTSITNTTIPIFLANLFQYTKLIHISSGCIYYGSSPNIEFKDKYIDTGWKESDFANPKSFYSKSKYAAELVLGDLPNVTTLRIRMPISRKNHPRNFISKIVAYNKVIDIPNSVTFLDDLSKCVSFFVNENHKGIFNIVNPGSITAAKVKLEYNKQYYIKNNIIDDPNKFEIINESELNKLVMATRSNCILSTTKLNNVGIKLRTAEELLPEYIRDYLN